MWFWSTRCGRGNGSAGLLSLHIQVIQEGRVWADLCLKHPHWQWEPVHLEHFWAIVTASLASHKLFPKSIWIPSPGQQKPLSDHNLLSHPGWVLTVSTLSRTVSDNLLRVYVMSGSTAFAHLISPTTLPSSFSDSDWVLESWRNLAKVTQLVKWQSWTQSHMHLSLHPSYLSPRRHGIRDTFSSPCILIIGSFTVNILIR